MRVRRFSLSRRKRFAAELRSRLDKARVIHNAISDEQARRFFNSFVMLPLSEWFSCGYSEDGEGIPQPEIREALLACEAAYQGKRAIKPVAASVSKLLAEYLPEDEDPDEHEYIEFLDDE